MPDLLEIYRSHAATYDRLVEREDLEHNLLPAIARVARVEDARVVELGAGTGRVTRLLVPAARSVEAYDTSPAMLAVAEATLVRSGRHNWRLGVADHRSVPAPSAAADICIAGWSVSCLAVYTGPSWQIEVRAALTEMERLAVPGGAIVIIETLGTGSESPDPPGDLIPYYELLADTGFASTWIRTDYRFRDVEEARELTRFFFGETPVAALRDNGGGVVLPECTGLWWKRRQA